MNRSILSLCTVLAALATSAWAVPELDASRGDAGFYDREFRNWVGMSGYPASHEARYRSFGGTSSYACFNTSEGGNRTVRYPFTLPQGRQLEWVRVWGRKEAGTTDVTLRLRRSCMSQSQTVPSTVTLSTQEVTGTAGEFSATLVSGESIDNLNCKLWVDVNFGSSSQACASSFNQLGIYKIRTQSVIDDRIFRHGFRVHAPN